MTKINIRNIYIIGAVTLMDVAVGTYERLVPSRGILYWLQTTVLAGFGEVPRGTTMVNVTNTQSMIMQNTLSSANMLSSVFIFIALAIVAAAIMGGAMTLGGRS